MLNVSSIRSEFPILQEKVNNKALVYLDNAATTHKPIHVLNAVNHYYNTFNSNIHRGVHTLSQKATIACEEARKTVQCFIHAQHDYEIIFTRGTTESINIIAQSFGKKYIQEGDEIIISHMEHHSNIVPWQMICEEKKAHLRIIPINEHGELCIESFASLLNSKTKIVSITHISNVLGTINPIKEIINKAHEYNIPVLIDGAQSIAHTSVNVQDLDVDFYVFSAHKVYGPTGIGVLYGKEKWLNELPPYQGGGGMISQVTFDKTIYNTLPFKFEAGTPDISGIIGLGVALEYMNQLSLAEIASYEHELLRYATDQLKQIEGVKIFGESKQKASVISFLINNIHAFDMGTILDHMGIAIRTGHHCAQPLMQYFQIAGTMRASFAFYNTPEEIDIFIQGVIKAKKMLE